jgi:hypothetical protein
MYSTSLPSSSLGPPDLLNLVQRIRDCGIYEYLECLSEPDWNHFQKEYLLSVPTQSHYQQLMKHFERSQLKARDLLIGYSFLYFDMDETTTEVFRAAKEWVRILHTDDLDDELRLKLLQAFAQYEQVYLEWKLEDRRKMLEKMTQMYWEYEINYRLYETQLLPEEKEYYLSEKQSRQAECLSMMKKIDNLEYFHKYQPVYVDSEFSEVLMDTLRKAFWDRLKEALFKEPPDFEPLYAIFKEIREHLVHITSHRPEFLVNYDDMIDIEYFNQRQQYEQLGVEFWLSRLEFIFELLIRLDSAEREKSHKEAFQKIKAIASFESCIEGLAYLMNRLLEIGKLYDSVFHPTPSE